MPKAKRIFNHGDRETRRRNALERLGIDDPECLICSERDPIALELHHIAKREFSDEIVPLCSTCHDKVSDLGKDRPSKIEGNLNPLEPIAHSIFGLSEPLTVAAEGSSDTDFAGLLNYVARKLREIGRTLIEQARAASASEEKTQ